MAPPISVCILACDEQAKIGHALASARACGWVGQIIVFDSGSTDQTVEIAKQTADRVDRHDWVDFTINRKAIVDAAANDWVFVLDADEEISDELREEIGSLSDDAFGDSVAVFTMPRKNYLLGRHVRAYDPDRIDRLFHRGRVRWPDRSVHDTRIAEGEVRHLRAAILHNRHADDFRDYFDGPRFAARTESLAQEMYAAGRRVSGIGVLMRAKAAWFKSYFLKGGILQGSFGIMIATKAFISTYLKYARLWHLQRQHKRAGSCRAGTGAARPGSPGSSKP